MMPAVFRTRTPDNSRACSDMFDTYMDAPGALMQVCGEWYEVFSVEAAPDFSAWVWTLVYREAGAA